MEIRMFRRWFPWISVVIIFAMGTSLLSWWQFSRREERVQQISEVIANYDRPIVPLEEALPGGAWSPELEWVPLSMRGSYRSEETYLVRNRPLGGRPGFLVLVPFVTDSGLVIAVERGWVPTGSLQDYPDWVPAVDSGERTVVVRVRAGEPDLNRQQVEGQLASIDLPDLAQRISDPALNTSFYGRLAEETPRAEEYAIQMPSPSLNEGNHLSYALQWILFAVMAFAALVWAIRAEIRQQKIKSGELIEKFRKRSRSQVDADYEDGIPTSR